MNRSSEPGARLLLRTIAALCVALVLVATTAEAGHSCEPVILKSGKETGVRAAEVNPGAPCLICVGAHTPGIAAPISPIAPEILVSAIAAPVPYTHRHNVASFALYIRPPPAA